MHGKRLTRILFLYVLPGLLMIPILILLNIWQIIAALPFLWLIWWPEGPGY